MKRAAFLVVTMTMASPSFGQSFSCRIGQDAARLDYGETVYTSQGKCVRQNDECFERYQCNYEGFACMSDVTECAEAHDKLLIDYRALVAAYDKMVKAGKDLAEAFDNLSAFHTDTRRCLALATSLEDAQTCGI